MQTLRLFGRRISRTSLLISLGAAVAVLIIGYVVTRSMAAGYLFAAEAEQGATSGSAQVLNDPTASGGKAIIFKAVETPPPTTPPTTPPVSGWPNASNVGLLTTTTKTISGAGIDDASFFKNNSFPGTGTATDPYLVNRVKFDGQVTLGNWGSSNLTGKWVKFTNCEFVGKGGSSSTPGGSAAVFARDNAPFFIIENSTLHGEGTLNFGLFSYVPFQLRNSNVSGANILVGFETERSEKTGVLIENNYIHDVRSNAGDHTDIINGNFHASHVVVRNNYLDGIRDGNPNDNFVANAFGIYDDPSSSAGIFENWTIEHNYITRAATLLLCTENKARFLDPFIVKDNVWGKYSLQSFACRAPSVQSGNTDINGKALTF